MLYFGYGSNLNLTALRAKGVEPRSSVCGMLRGWRLVFDMPHWFPIEGGVGNIRHTGLASDRVLGLVHACAPDDLAKLDALEANGVAYQRRTLTVETGTGPREAIAYVGLPEVLDASCIPSRRYLTLLVAGAEAAGLDPDYVAGLRAQPVMPVPSFAPFTPPPGARAAITPAELAAHPAWTALSGLVFDMSAARVHLHSFRTLAAGRDLTLFHLRRHDTSDGTETEADLEAGRVHPAACQYLNAYLHAYATEFRCIGRLTHG